MERIRYVASSRLRDSWLLAGRAVELLQADPAELTRVVYGKAKGVAPTPTGKKTGRIGSVAFEFDFHATAASDSNKMMGMMYRRTYQPEITVVMRQHLTRGCTFVDVGASVGYFSAVAADLVGRHGVVHAFEPVPQYFRSLQRLVDLNPHLDIRANCMAVGEGASEVEMYVNEGDNFGINSLVKSHVPFPSEPIKVPMIRLDEYLQNGERVDMIKIDVESSELSVLQSMSGVLARLAAPPLILCEIYPAHYAALGYSTTDLAAWVHSNGYFARDLLKSTPIDLMSVSGLRDVLLVPNRR
jgi:FkbM family methyltransferase